MNRVFLRPQRALSTQRFGPHRYRFRDHATYKGSPSASSPSEPTLPCCETLGPARVCLRCWKRASNVHGCRRLYVTATAKPQGKGKGSRASKAGGSASPTGISSGTTAPSGTTTSNTRANVESAQSQAKAQTDSTARQAEAQLDDTAGAAKDAAQDTKYVLVSCCWHLCTGTLHAMLLHLQQQACYMLHHAEQGLWG